MWAIGILKKRENIYSRSLKAPIQKAGGSEEKIQFYHFGADRFL